MVLLVLCNGTVRCGDGFYGVAIRSAVLSRDVVTCC